MVKYSTSTDAALIANVTHTAISVDLPSIKAITSGPNSLQNKSMRRIRAFMTRFPVSSCVFRYASCAKEKRKTANLDEQVRCPR